MKTTLILCCFSLFLVCTVHGYQTLFQNLRSRWNTFFAPKNRTEVVLAKLKNRKSPDDCRKQIKGTLMFHGFAQMFYTYDNKAEACVFVYGLGVNHEAPNVFWNFWECKFTCCPFKTC